MLCCKAAERAFAKTHCDFNDIFGFAGCDRSNDAGPIGSIKIMDMIGRNDDGDIVVGTEAADGSDWVEDDLDTDF